MTSPKTGVIVSLVVISGMVIWFELVVSHSFIGSDDAYIHLRYIDNLRSGNGFGFNPGKPSNGSTSPLWVLLASVVTRGAVNLPTAAKLLSTVLFVLSILAFFAFTRSLTDSPTVAALASVVYASYPWLLKWAGSAMETSLVAFLILSAGYFFIRVDKHRDLILASLLLGLSTLARPEVVLLFVLFLLLVLMTGESSSLRIRRLSTAIGTYLAVLGPWLLFSWSEFGSVLPNTFAAKIVASESSIGGVGWYFLRVIGVTYWLWILVFLCLAFLTLRNFNARVLPSLDFKKRAVILLWAWCAIVPVFYALGKLQTPSSRYLQITTPILIALGCHGFMCLVNKRSSERQSKRRPLIFMVAGTAVAVFCNIVLNALVVFPSSQDFSEGVLKTYETVGEWLGAKTPERSRVAVLTDIGVIGYVSHREIIDLGGLNTPEAIAYVPDNLGYVFESKPEYLVLTSEDSEHALLGQGRFQGVASLVLSLPVDIGLRGGIEEATGGRKRGNFHVSAYRLLWSAKGRRQVAE